MSLQENLLATGHRLARLDDGPVLSWDGRSETLRLLRSPEPGLPTRLSTTGGNEVVLRLLGSEILVRCGHERTAREIAGYFAASVVTETTRTPDCIVECDWASAGRYLFRARPAHLEPELAGVRVQMPGDPGPRLWVTHQPPIPPLAGRLLKDRFIALHAAAGRHPSGGVVLFVGARRSGKTTTILDLVRNHGWSLLTDEMAFIARRSTMIEPFPRSVGVADEIDSRTGTVITKRYVPVPDAVQRVALEPCFVTHVVLLEPSDAATRPCLAEVPPSTTLGKLLPHHLDVGCDPDESFVTLLGLAERCRGAVFCYGHPTDLPKLPEMLSDLWAFDLRLAMEAKTDQEGRL